MTAARNDALILRALVETNWWDDRIAPRLVLDEATGCLNWTGATNSLGYGRAKIPAAIIGAATQEQGRIHRVALIRSLGRVLGDGMVVDHLCRNPRCCQPSHLREASVSENLTAPGSLSVAARNLAKPLCPQGHDLNNPANLKPDPRGWRRCRVCDRDRRAVKRLRRTA